MNESDINILNDILSYCNDIEERINRFNITQETFISDDAMQDLLLMPIFQIGELAGCLSNIAAEKTTQIPWHAIRGFRNVIAHDYTNVEPAWAWNTATLDVPKLKSEIENLLSNL